MMAPTDQTDSAYYVVEAHHIQRCQSFPHHQPTFVQDIQGIHPHSVTFPILPSNATVADTLFNGYTTSSCAVKKARKENHHYLKFTDSQVNVLEQFFEKNRKPGRVDKEDLAQQLGVQISRINHWFQNRKQKERADKQRLEAAFSQKLERAGARRKHMRKGSNSMPVVMSASDINMLLPVQSGSAHNNAQLSPLGVSLPPNPSINCASRSEACCESLKRTLLAGKAAAEAAGYGNTLASDAAEAEAQKQPHSAHDCQPPNLSLNPFDPNFYPVSAFSDWGSTSSSMPSYTPTPAGQGEDPFEFDSPSLRGSPAYTEFQDVSADCSARCSTTFPQDMLPVCYQDQYAYFVAMAEINASRASESIALRQPPSSRRPSKVEEEDKEVTPTPEDNDVKMDDTGSRRPSLTRSMTCPDMVVMLDAAESYDDIRSDSDDDEMSTVTSEAITKVPAKLPRSHSFNGQIPLLTTGGNVKKNKASSIRNRIQKVKDEKNIPRSPLHVEQFSNGGYFDHTADSSMRAESDVCSDFSLEAEHSLSGRLTPPTPISPSEQYSISRAEPRIVELDKDMSPHEPRPQRVNNCRRIFELTTPMVESECGDQIEPQFDPSDINFFGLNMLSSGFDYQEGLDSNYPNVLAFEIPAGYEAPPAPPIAYGNHY